MLVGAGGAGTSWLQSSFSMHHTHTSSLSFTCSKYTASRGCKSEAQKMQREHPNCALIFAFFFSLYAVVGEAAISLRRTQAGSTTLGTHGVDSNALKMHGLLSADQS
jgi:hypothetical protein